MCEIVSLPYFRKVSSSLSEVAGTKNFSREMSARSAALTNMIVHGADFDLFKVQVPKRQKSSTMTNIPDDKPYSAETYTQWLVAQYPHDPKEDFFTFELCLPLDDNEEEVNVYSGPRYRDCVAILSKVLGELAAAGFLSGLGFKIHFYQGNPAREIFELAKACSEDAGNCSLQSSRNSMLPVRQDEMSKCGTSKPKRN
jgi:hypothetical protein